MDLSNSGHDFLPIYDEADKLETPGPAQVEVSINVNTERLQLLDLSGLQIPIGHKAKCLALGNAWDFLSVPDAGHHLSRGDSYFGFVCKPALGLNEDDLLQLKTIVNLSGFPDEVIHNNCPVIDVTDSEQLKNLTIIMVKAMYILPGFELNNMNRDVMASLEYQRACQPGGPKFWDDCTEESYLRSTKPLIKFVYSIVIQFQYTRSRIRTSWHRFGVSMGWFPKKQSCWSERSEKNPQWIVR